jgi:NAD(P)-dependent dehydrogenase (short-subunit alcohol dehydrogenase family)
MSDTDELSFEGKVAIVTGAGGNPGLGRSHAMLLASRGAKVVVNDLGVGPDGLGRRNHRADGVVAEIVDAGGEAIVDTNSVAEEASASAVVKTALDAWGKVDILINNAGVVMLAGFDEITSNDLRRIVDVHLYGTIWMCRAVWPHMSRAGGGRIVNTVSGALLGCRYLSIYGAAKGGILSLTRSLAVEGADRGIAVNALGPAARTSALELLSKEEVVVHAPSADLVAPMAAYLAHEICPASGSFIESYGGHHVMRAFAETAGYGAGESTTIEDVAANFETITDFADFALVPEPLLHPMSASINRRPYVAG